MRAIFLIPTRPPPTNPAVAERTGDESSFKQHVHDLFMQAFAREMRDACGVRVALGGGGGWLNFARLRRAFFGWPNTENAPGYP